MVLPFTSIATHLSSVNLGRALERLLQPLERKILCSGDFKDRRLAPAAQFGGIRQLGRNIGRNDDGTVTVGMNEIVRSDGHAGNAHLATETFGMDPGVRRSNRTGQGLEARRPLRDIADRAVGDHAEAASALCTLLCTSPQNAPY